MMNVTVVVHFFRTHVQILLHGLMLNHNTILLPLLVQAGEAMFFTCMKKKKWVLTLIAEEINS